MIPARRGHFPDLNTNRPCALAATPQPAHQAVAAVVSTACLSSPSTSDTATRTIPGNPSMAVRALPLAFTWDLLHRVVDTAIPRPQAPAERWD